MLADDDPALKAARRRLAKSGRTYGKAYAALSAARIERDEAIREASKLGVSRREVAQITDMTPGRIQQILGE